MEIYREYAPNGAVTLERETLQVMGDSSRVAMVETRTAGQDNGPAALVRYQLADHRESSAVELDESARLLTYEEYFPFGATSYRAARSAIEVSAKRYRFTAMERDDETGFSHHGARYYAPWLGRWVSCDPADLIDGTNLYAYASGNPIVRVDPSGTEGEGFFQRAWKIEKAFREGQGKAVKQIFTDTVEGIKALPEVAKALADGGEPDDPYVPLVTKDYDVRRYVEKRVELAKEKATIVGEIAKGIVTAPFDAAEKSGNAYGEGLRAAQEGDYEKAARKFGEGGVHGADAVLSVAPTGAAAGNVARSGIKATRGAIKAVRTPRNAVKALPKVGTGPSTGAASSPLRGGAPAQSGGATTRATPSNVNTAPPGTDRINCGDCSGAVALGDGRGSTKFAERGGAPEGGHYPGELRSMVKNAGGKAGALIDAKSPLNLAQQLSKLPAGTNVIVFYSSKSGKTAGHFIVGMVGKKGKVIYVDAQLKPVTQVYMPADAKDIRYFTATQVPR